MIREATSISEVSPSLETCDNTLENLKRRAGNSHDGSTRGALVLHGVFPCSYSLRKQNKVKRAIVHKIHIVQPSWDETKISLRGVPRHPKVHACV
jgi:hypothetical protein